MEESSITAQDLPDLTDWAYVPIWTLEQAILIWAGIDPAFYGYHNLPKFHPAQIRRARIAQQAFTTGIALRTLIAHELYLRYQDGCGVELANQQKAIFSYHDIDIGMTTIQQMAIVEWARKQRIPTIKQTLKQKIETASLQPKSNDSPQTVIQQIPYIPKHENPELETANEISQILWDKTPVGVKPLKSLCTREKISEIYERKAGVKPLPAVINRIDTIARPPAFKNHGKKEKG